mgnify:CR=1 FL=1
MGLFFSLRRRDADFSGTRPFVRRFGAARARRRAARWGRAQGGVAVDAGGRRSTIATISAGAVAAICKVCAKGWKWAFSWASMQMVPHARRWLALAEAAVDGASGPRTCAAFAVLTRAYLADDRVGKSGREC